MSPLYHILYVLLYELKTYLEEIIILVGGGPTAEGSKGEKEMGQL